MSTVHIPADKVELDGELILPPSAKGGRYPSLPVANVGMMMPSYRKLKF